MIRNIATAIAREKWRGLNYDNMKACRGMYKRIMHKEFSILIGREISILRSNRLALAIQRPVHVDTKRLPLPTPDPNGGEAPAARRQVWQQRRSHNGLTPQAQQQN